MISNYHNNYGLFDKYLNKVKVGTISKFGSLNQVQTFLHHLAEQGNVLLAVKNYSPLKLSPLELAKLIKSDKYLAKCIDLALQYAAEVVEAVLYDRAINGYEELTFDKEGEVVARKRKYCSKSLLEYLKANSPKYQRKVSKDMRKPRKTKDGNDNMNFEIESYESWLK